MFTPFLLVSPLLAQGAGQPQDGFVLLAPQSGTDAHLLDNQGQVVHTWPGTIVPGNAVYLLPGGNLLRTLHRSGSLGGSGGGLQEVAYDGTVVFDFTYDNADHLSHHDVEVLPNGNVLVIAWEYITRGDAIAAGRNPAYLSGSVFAPDHLIEVVRTGPSAGQIVWEWHLMDHLVQDFDPSKSNYGVVADHPELMDINYPPRRVNQGDWNHVNSVDYHPGFDQIVISSHNINEFWVIDHSTTTAEAASHSGGQSGMGGDFLYRWGNPEAYGRGTPANRMLWGQHDVQWIDDGRPGAGNFLLFNNGLNRPAGAWSSIDELVPPVDSAGNYSIQPGTAFGPTQLAWTWSATNPPDFYSQNISGCERMDNGNTLVCSGNQGWLFEVTPAGDMVWEHQNTLPSPNTNRVFKVRRYTHFLWPEVASISASVGGTVEFHMKAGTHQAGRNYVLAACVSGTSPGTTIPGTGLTVPLNRDYVTDFVLANLNSSMLGGFAGTLDAQGAADALLNTMGALPPAMAGRTVHFAFVLTNPVDFASNAMGIEVLP
jgi:hypothetical protein